MSFPLPKAFLRIKISSSCQFLVSFFNFKTPWRFGFLPLVGCYWASLKWRRAARGNRWAALYKFRWKSHRMIILQKLRWIIKYCKSGGNRCVFVSCSGLVFCWHVVQHVFSNSSSGLSKLVQFLKTELQIWKGNVIFPAEFLWRPCWWIVLGSLMSRVCIFSWVSTRAIDFTLMNSLWPILTLHPSPWRVMFHVRTCSRHVKWGMRRVCDVSSDRDRIQTSSAKDREAPCDLARLSQAFGVFVAPKWFFVEEMGHLLLSKKIFQFVFSKLFFSQNKWKVFAHEMVKYIFVPCLFWFPDLNPSDPVPSIAPGMWPFKKAMQILYEHCWRAKQTLPLMLCMWLRRRRRLRC